jgi:TolB-like protein/Flp pilus assembly protein TadD
VKYHNFFTELKRRNVYKVAVAYAVVGWLLVQVATQVFPFFEIPNWGIRLVVLIIAIGFLIALLIAWAFELTPEGIKSTEDADATAKQSRGRAWIYVAVVGAVLSLGLFVLGRYTAPRAGSSESRRSPAVGDSATAKSIAILPFENLSDDKANAYFAEGVKDEILTKLAAVRDLKVISRTSTAKYQSKPDNLKAVAQELGVSTILEGAVQRAANQVRVNVQLIDAATDTHLWAKSYDRDFKDVLGVQSAIAEEIAEALKANLSPSESHVLAAIRTQNTEAYDLFLRAQYEFHQAQSTLVADAFDRADAFYQQALARDPNFAEAAAGLAYNRLMRHWFVSPLSPRELEEVKSIIDHALVVAPNSPEAHVARGVFFYWAHRQYDDALAEFNRALELQPNNALAQQFLGWVYRRRGEWERSIADAQRAQELDPRDPSIPSSLGGIYAGLRLWNDAERVELRTLTLDPYNTVAATLLATVRLNSTGDINFARHALDGFPPDIQLNSLTYQGDVTAIVGIRAYVEVFARHFNDAFQAFEKQMANSSLAHLQQLAGRAALRVLAGDVEAAKSAGEEARPLLEARVKERPDDTFAMTQLAWVYLALGRNADALRVAQKAAELMPIEKDTLSGAYFQTGLAQIEARAGAPEEAVKRLRHLLSIPAGQPMSIARLKIDPVWDPIRDRPDFQQLLAGTEQIGPNK